LRHILEIDYSKNKICECLVLLNKICVLGFQSLTIDFLHRSLYQAVIIIIIILAKSCVSRPYVDFSSNVANFLYVILVSFKDDVVLKVIIGIVIDYY
jgi:hypothetical protein